MPDRAGEASRAHAPQRPAGFAQTLGFILLLSATGLGTWRFFDHGVWIAFAVALFAHGTVDSFIGSATHELSHGTVFKTKWVNTFFLYALALISWFNPRDFKLSHTYHHLYTLHPRADREVVLPTKPSLHPIHVLQLLTLNIVGGRNEPYSFPIAQNVWAVVRLAFTGRQGKEWLKAVYEGHDGELKKAANWARVILLFNAAVIAVSIVFRLWPLALIVTFAPFTANWLRYYVFVPMHTGLKDDVDDFRLCVRSITLDPISHFLYWRMNWHTEHHMFAAVPCYNLRKLHKTVAADMPKPRSFWGSWREMRRIWKEQKAYPVINLKHRFRDAGAGKREGTPPSSPLSGTWLQRPSSSYRRPDTNPAADGSPNSRRPDATSSPFYIRAPILLPDS